MPEEDLASRDVIRAAIESFRMERGWPDILLAPPSVDDLAERIDRALVEYRTAPTGETLMLEADRDEARAALAELEEEVRMLGEIVKGSSMGINGIPLQDFGGLPRIAALLRQPSEP